jgi:curved DNA-binding protein CbpA
MRSVLFWRDEKHYGHRAMGMEQHYRSLGLKPGASREQIKAAYRSLARELHPDRRSQEPSTPESAQRSAKRSAKFLVITQAYKQLMAQHPPEPAPQSRQSPDETLKYQTYQRLRQLFSQQRFPNAIALVEGLAHRFPDDAEVRQWAAIAYQQQGLRLMGDKQYAQASRYLQKAIATDPTNRKLKVTTHRALQTIERLTRPHPP